MISLKPTIAQIETLLLQDTEASLTYAALECRLAIERICYDRLKTSHEYIPHSDLRKWQPRDIINVLIEEANPHAASTLTLSISTEPFPQGNPPTSAEQFQGTDFTFIGEQIGFDANKLGKLWNALAGLALHVRLPVSKDDSVYQYGDPSKIKAKVREALEEIKRISQGNLVLGGFGEEVSFTCSCGTMNKRKLGLIKSGQVISCINPECPETYDYVETETAFGRRFIEIACRNCGTKRQLARKLVEKLSADKHLRFECEMCKEEIRISLQPAQAQKTALKREVS